MTIDTVHFNVYCTTMKKKQQQQATFWYSKTVLYNGNSTFNTSITSLLPNTTYRCCVLAVTSYGESEPVCQNITIATTNTTVTTVTLNQTPPSMTNKSTFSSTIPWVGGILVGVMSGILVMVIVWVIVTIIGKKKTKANMKKRYFICNFIVVHILIDHMMVK